MKTAVPAKIRGVNSMKLCRKFLFLAVLAGLAMAGLAPPVRADFTVRFSDSAGDGVTVSWNGGTPVVSGVTGTTNVGSGANFFAASPGPGFTENITVVNLNLGGNFAITASASNSNTPGSAGLAQISMGSISIAYKGLVSDTLTIDEQSTGFAQPTVPPFVVYTQGNVVTNSNPTAIYKTQVNGSDVPESALTLGLLTASTEVPISSPGSPFTLGGVLTIGFTGPTTVTDISTVSTISTPEPSSFALFGIGAFSMCGYYWRRRKGTVA